MEKKKLLYAASNMRHINNFHLDYINALRADGYAVKIMANGEGADFNIPFEKKLFSPKNAYCRKKIRKIVENSSFDAIVLHTSLAAFHIRFALRRKNRPKIVNFVHGYLFSNNINPIKRALLLLCERIVRGKTDAIVTMNREDRHTAEKYLLTVGKIYEIKGMGASVRDEITPPDTVRREFFPDASFVLTFVGELSKRKNQSFLIEALGELKRHIPSAVLCLVGDGSEKATLIEKARSLGLGESVIFAGERKDACDFMRACDLYVSASVIEGMPFNLIEALGVGKTVLASRVKGHVDLIEEGADGFLYTCGDTGDFVNKVLLIYNGKISPDPEKITEKYSKYEKSSVFPETYSVMKEVIK